MAILTRNFGNNSNILFQNLHLAAFCKQNNIKFYNPFVFKYIDIFPNLKSLQLAENGDNGKFLRLKSFFAKDFCNPLLENEYKQWLIDHGQGDVWIKGGCFRAPDEVIANKKYFQHLFTPVFDERVKLELSLIKSRGKVLSVHVRRGDYRTWQNGKFYYDDAIYLNAINDVLAKEHDIKTVAIYSNEAVNLATYKKLNVEVVTPGGGWPEEQWKMAQSDFIIGPPSTFSMWASFVGNVPVWLISEPNSIPQFSVCNG